MWSNRLEPRLQPLRAGPAEPQRRQRYKGRGSLGPRPVLTLALLLVAALGAAAVLASPAGAPVSRSAPPFWKVWKLQAGSWAKYKVQSGTPGLRSCTLRLAVVGKQVESGDDWYWVEVSCRPLASSGELVNRVLFRVQRGKVEFKRAVTSVPGHRSMELPESWLWAWGQGDLRAASGYMRLDPQNLGTPALWSGCVGQGAGPLSWSCAMYVPGYYSGVRIDTATHLEMPMARQLSPEKVATPAGTFDCEHWRYGHDSGDVWVSPGAGPFGLVKAVSQDRVGYKGLPLRKHATSIMVLTRIGGDARDKITGQPRSSDPSNLWYWIWEKRWSLLRLRLPQLGLPEP